MKKLLSLFAALGLAATTSATVVSCGGTTEEKTTTSAAQTAADAIVAKLSEGKFETKDDVKLSADDAKAIGVIEYNKDAKDLTADTLGYTIEAKAAEQETKDGEGTAPTKETFTVSVFTTVQDDVTGTFSFKEDGVDLAELTAAIEGALKIEIGDKTQDAFDTLTDAIKAAQTVSASEKATQDDVDAAVKTLNDAVDIFNASAPAENGNGGETPTTPEVTYHFNDKATTEEQVEITYTASDVEETFLIFS